MNLDFEDKFRKTILKIEEVGNLYAEARGQSYQMQEMRSSILASVIKEYPNLPISKAEIEGKSSPEYRQHIEETAKAITKELRLKCEYEKWKSSFEALRSLSSLEKAQINNESH